MLDPNVLVSGALSPRGAPGQLLRACGTGDLELILSPLLLAELERVLGYPKLRQRIDEARAERLMRWLQVNGTLIADPVSAAAVRSADPADDYLVALAAAERCALVSGDGDLLALAGRIPVFAPRDFLAFVRSHAR